MDITAFDIWLITRLDSLGTFAFFMTMAIVAVCVILFMVWLTNFDRLSESNKEVAKTAVKYLWRLIPAFLALSLLCISIPSTKTATAMYIIPKVMKSEMVQSIPDYAKQLMDKVLGIDVNTLVKGAVKDAKGGLKEVVKEAKEALKEG